jgi:hypothetical protein
MASQGCTPPRRPRLRRRPAELVLPASPRPQRRDCQGQLIAAIERTCGGAVIRASLRPWCSATFVGAQHQLTVRLATGDAAGWTARLPDAEFALHGHIVADLAVDEESLDAAGNQQLALTILTIEAW